jgi:hypothetical protein
MDVTMDDGCFSGIEGKRCVMKGWAFRMMGIYDNITKLR